MEEKTCGNCKHRDLSPYEKPCHDCKEPELKGWEPPPPPGIVYRGLDIGAPEGDKTNVRLDWGESGTELIRTEDITSADQLKDGNLVETAQAAVKQITRLDYAIAGVRSKMSSIGIKLTDKDLSRDEIGFMIGQLNALQADLFELEEDRERKLRGAADVEIKDRDS